MKNKENACREEDEKLKNKLKRKIVRVCRIMLKENLNINPFGNVSCRLGKRILITPSGMSYEKMRAKDVVEIDLEGKSYGGKPSSEYRMHIEIYKAREDVKAIIHAHPKYATAFAVSRVGIPVFLEEIAEVVGSSIEVSKYALPGSKELARIAAEALRNKNATLLANHGVVCVGDSLEEALDILRILERSAEIYILAKIIGNPYVLDDKNVKKLREMYLKYKSDVNENV